MRVFFWYFMLVLPNLFIGTKWLLLWMKSQYILIIDSSKSTLPFHYSIPAWLMFLINLQSWMEMPFSATGAPHNSGMKFNFLPSSGWFPFNSNWLTGARTIHHRRRRNNPFRALLVPSFPPGLFYVLMNLLFFFFARIAAGATAPLCKSVAREKCAFVADTRTFLYVSCAHIPTHTMWHCVLCCAQIKPRHTHTDDLVYKSKMWSGPFFCECASPLLSSTHAHISSRRP